MRQFFVQKNTYELTGTDVNWIYAHTDGSARYLITGLIQRRFDKSRQRFGTDKKLAEACVAFAKSAEFEFSKNSVDRVAWESFVNIKNLKPTARIEAFRLLWRGYSDSDIAIAAKGIKNDLENFKGLLAKTLSKNDSLKKRASKKGNTFRERAFKANHLKLKEIEKTINRAFQTDPMKIAWRKPYHKVSLRRKRNPWARLFPFPDDYLGVRAHLREYDPDLVTFPLRYMTHLPAESYNSLRTMWLEKVSREEIILALAEAEVKSDFSLHDELDNLNSILKSELRQDRANAFKELRFIYKHECYHATTLLAVTQTEGVLWDFASYLNRRNIRIFKQFGRNRPKPYPYAWDLRKNLYKHVNSTTGRPICEKLYYDDNKKGKQLGSARELLQRTRLGSIVSPDLYSYLVDEFYDERTPLAHGRVTDRNFKVDAIAARYCLYTCMLEVAKYLEKIKV